MKNKNLYVICAAAGLCIASVFALIGCMGNSAEKIGTTDFVPTVMESESSDTLTDVLNKVSYEKDAGAPERRETEGMRSDEELKVIWDQIFERYTNSDYYEPVEEVSRIYWDWEKQELTYQDPKQENDESTKASAHVSETSANRQELDDAVLDASEAGLILLKEIDWLYPENDLEHLIISSFGMGEVDTGAEHPLVVKWRGCLEDVYSEYGGGNRTSYYFEMDAITGKISEFECFYPCDSEKDYTDIIWTDEQILDRAKEVVEKYHLADGEELDWSGAQVYNETENIDFLQQDLKRPNENGVLPDISIRNSVSLFKGESEYFRLELDFETGDLVEYSWTDYYMM